MNICNISTDEIAVREWEPYTYNTRNLFTPKDRITISFHAQSNATAGVLKDATIKVTSQGDGFVITISGEDATGKPVIAQDSPKESYIITAMKALDWPTIIKYSIGALSKYFLSMI